jgi:hypothetical protein
LTWTEPPTDAAGCLPIQKINERRLALRSSPFHSSTCWTLSTNYSLTAVVTCCFLFCFSLGRFHSHNYFRSFDGATTLHSVHSAHLVLSLHCTCARRPPPCTTLTASTCLGSYLLVSSSLLLVSRALLCSARVSCSALLCSVHVLADHYLQQQSWPFDTLFPVLSREHSTLSCDVVCRMSESATAKIMWFGTGPTRSQLHFDR